MLSPICKWGFAKATYIERVHLQFCKKLQLLNSPQTDFVYGELGRYSFQNIRSYEVIKY